MQGAQYGNASHRGVGGVGGAQRVLGQQGDDGVDLRIDLGDAIQVRLQDLARRHLPGGDQIRKGGGVPVVQGFRVLSNDRTVGQGGGHGIAPKACRSKEVGYQPSSTNRRPYR